MTIIDTNNILPMVRAEVKSRNQRRHFGSDGEDRDRYEDYADYDLRIDEIINCMTVLDLLMLLNEMD